MRDRLGARGYVLAGGRSVRMGRDKAEVVFRGETMLERAVATMASLCDEVVVVGLRERVPEGASLIADRFPGCGPMGGIEAALEDCERHGAAYAVFLPVDVPLLPGGLLRSLVEVWTRSETVRVGVAVADGRVQPLVSLIHVGLRPALEAALLAGNHRLQPELRAAAQALADRVEVPLNEVFLATTLTFGDQVVFAGDGSALSWRPSAAEWDTRSAWFANLNTPEDLQEVLAAKEKD